MPTAACSSSWRHAILRCRRRPRSRRRRSARGPRPSRSRRRPLPSAFTTSAMEASGKATERSSFVSARNQTAKRQVCRQAQNERQAPERGGPARARTPFRRVRSLATERAGLRRRGFSSGTGRRSSGAPSRRCRASLWSGPTSATFPRGLRTWSGSSRSGRTESAAGRDRAVLRRRRAILPRAHDIPPSKRTLRPESSLFRDQATGFCFSSQTLSKL